MFGSDNFELHFYHCAFLLHSHSLTEQQSCCAVALVRVNTQQLSRSLHTPTLNRFCLDDRNLSSKKLFCLKKYKSVKQQFSFWFFLIFSRAPFFRISNKVDSDSPGYLLSCHGCFFYRRNNFIKFQLRPLWTAKVDSSTAPVAFDLLCFFFRNPVCV